ncbi:nucleoside diphosphate kinase 7 [Holotrichia oblita]|uniref:Nucleoside diphosphate kinase 7 n=2 Tax=Holotrichia oblita TaxID=644536 RepID=A0ACB9TL55_HOLOL|nr:nucleoside diphosphate kinase 7 [Holotrichia oblita]KAI4467531.1 nucleoside diphosphate kinase 7 [Holotrichia oblita]
MNCNNAFDYSTKLCFKAQWYDYESGYLRNFKLTYFPYDNTLELFDEDFNRMFLRRSASEQIELDNFYIGANLRVYGRQIEIIDYADIYTKNYVSKTKEHTFALVKTSAVNKIGEVINEIQGLGFKVCRMRMCVFSRREALDFYEHRKGDVFLPFTVEHLISGPIIGLELVGSNVINRWREAMGPTDPEVARKTAPQTLRARYGESLAANAFHGSDSFELAVKEACYFFPQGTGTSPPKPTAKFHNSTCCVIKPHVIKDGNFGNVLSSITNNDLFKITALQMIYLTDPDAEEFLEVYKGVISDFHALLMSFLNGPCVVLEISAKQDGLDVHREFRTFAGPMNSLVARQIRPNSLRAMYGRDKYENAIHCTDLPEDTQLELEYFFKILE